MHPLSNALKTFINKRKQNAVNQNIVKKIKIKYLILIKPVQILPFLVIFPDCHRFNEK